MIATSASQVCGSFAERIESGKYDNASEVIRAALRSLERDEQTHDAKLAALRGAIDAGDASGIAEGVVFARARSALSESAVHE